MTAELFDALLGVVVLLLVIAGAVALVWLLLGLAAVGLLAWILRRNN